MADTPMDVLVAGYQDLDKARKDFDGLVGLVKGRRVKVEGVILVAHDASGEVTVADTGDHAGRKGLGWGAGVGVAVGLFAPPLLASAAVGGAAGALAGKFADHKLKTGIAGKLGQALPPGSAGVIAVFPDDDRLAIERALVGSVAKSLVESDSTGLIKGLKSSLAEAMGKFVPDRSRLPIGDPGFAGTLGRTLSESVPDWSINMTPEPPEGAPNVLLVLIDDSGFGNPATFGGPVATPTMSRVAEAGLTYNRFHVTAMCSPTRAALLTGRNNHAVGFGSVGELPGPFPGYTSAVPKTCAPLPRTLKDNGYATAGFGKWHLTPDHLQGAAGPHDRWPLGWGFGHYWGFIGAESGQYDPLLIQDNTIIGVPEAEDGGQFYLPDAMTARAIKWLHTVRAQDPIKPWFLYYYRLRPRPAPRPGRLERQVPGQVRPGLGQAARADLRPAEETRRDPPRCGLDAAAGRVSRVGLPVR